MTEREGSLCNATNIVWKQEVSPESGRKFVEQSIIRNTDMRLESGTCNVCSAPCSSCMHLNRSLMGSKAEEFSDENCRLGEANQYSMDDGDGSSVRSRACERLKHVVSETSNIPSVDSSHDSLSENAESRRALSEKYQESKCLEGLDDNTSCISGASNANLVNGSHQTNADRINISCSSASVSHLGAEGSGSGPSVDLSGLSEILSSKDADIPENFTEGCVENVDLSLTKERAPIIVSGEKYLADNDSPVNGTAKVSLNIYTKSEADTDNDVGNAKVEVRKYSVHDELHEKAGELVKSPGMPDTKSEDESDDSDVVEHDIKVCDICGDAGREDLLAICSRCSDGAEHTYCMREMLQKVPEGNWLCEECKYAEGTENRRPYVEEKKYHKVISASQVSGKRPSESVEVATAAKRQALESKTGSPKGSSPKKMVPVSQESSFKSLDIGKVKSGHQIPIRNNSGHDGIQLGRSHSAGPRSQTSKSTLLKSNSLNINSKPRVKLVDEVVPQKQKGGGEHTSKNMETPARTINKSMSFKSSNLGRSSSTESKVKMLSPKSGTAQDLKGSRLAKESGAFDRKLSSRIDRPMVCSTTTCSVVSTSKGEQKLTPRGETAKPSAVNSNKEFKVNQDGKLSSLSKSMSNISRKILEAQVSSERTSPSVDETQQDGIPRSQETENQVDKIKDSSSDRVRSGVTYAPKSPFCHKCKDFGHPTECCTIGSPQEFGAEVSATSISSSKEETHEGNRLKAVIQEALRRRPDIYKTKEVPDEFCTLGTDLNCEVTSQDQVLVSNTLKNSISAEETDARQEILDNSTFETSKCLSANDLKQLNFRPTDFCSQPGKPDSVGPASGKPVVRALPNLALADSNVLSKISATPEYEYIWQGVFEVHISGKPPDLYTGIQAHLSTCASPKVLEVVNKFLPKLSLNVVSRLSTWPSQFHQAGAKEDNIALYFFAKDIESYERHYKGLLDHMIRNDLAFKGVFDGVELLIFPSNQLPENSQRWNMLFFLWGVFKGRRIDHSDSAKKICIPSLYVMPTENDFPTAVMTLSETRCSPKRMDEESIACGKACSALLPSTSKSSINQGHIMEDSVPEHGQYRGTKHPETMGTSVSGRIVDYDISVKQENSLSWRIPSVGNQEIGTSSNISKDKISERTNNDGEDQGRPKRKQIENDLNINMEATIQGDLTVKSVNCQLPNDKKLQHVDLSDTVMQASAVSCQKIPWNEVNGKFENRESSSKRLKTDFSGIYGCYSSGGRDSSNNSFASLANDIGSCSSVEDKGCKEACDEKIIHEDFGAMERTFFPVDAHNKSDLQFVLNSMSLKGSHEYEDQFQVGIPNLELALGGETSPPRKGMLPFFLGAEDKKNNQEKPPDILADEQGDDSAAASLSLSLSFPSSNKEHMEPVSKAEHLPDVHHVNTSLLLFGKFSDK